MDDKTISIEQFIDFLMVDTFIKCKYLNESQQ